MGPVQAHAGGVVMVAGWPALVDVVATWLGARPTVREADDLGRIRPGSLRAGDVMVVGPGLDEAGVAGLLRRVAKRIPVVVIVAEPGAEAQVRWLRLGASAVLPMCELTDGAFSGVLREVRAGRSVVKDDAMNCLQESLRREGQLTDGQLVVARMLVSGTSTREMAERLCVAETTVKTRVQRMRQRFDAPDRRSLVVLLRDLGLADESNESDGR